MVRIVPATRVIAALAFSAALAGGAAVANAQPCQIDLANGQVAPCAPGVVSTQPGDPGGGNDAASEPAEFVHVPLEHSFPEPAPEEPEDPSVEK
ncbi:hypothetical protein RD149_07265 [Gordonia westfalica]|uniref:Uncharacterized protein n=1 Tax=Gordonia westfalica TaxID=158898 RepID=A0A1H2HSS0_9ACTN|nr:hypothetical protein [Gordonia westfalica]MDS1113566.1 hypothetical protein [Gordonia westfalica]SDU34799.1 hypothetical protein SAMN04488548_134651 [Gordonia westfalica]